MVIAWFSCGATSAVACKIALTLYSDVRIVYIETHSGHPDNERFIRDCERWYGRKIERISSTPNRGDMTAIVPECSLFCAIEFENIKDRQTDAVMNGEMSINEAI